MLSDEKIRGVKYAGGKGMSTDTCLPAYRRIYTAPLRESDSTHGQAGLRRPEKR